MGEKPNMKLKRWCLIVSSILLIVLLCNNVIYAENVSNEADIYKYDFEVDVQNNFIGLDTLFNLKDLAEDLAGREVFPTNLLGREKWNLKIQLMQNGTNNKGVFYFKSGWDWATGDSAKFINDYKELHSTDGPRRYDLGFQNEKYSLIGIYTEKQFAMGDIEVILDGNVFSCLSYGKMNLTGMGNFYTDIDESFKKDFFGTYRSVTQAKDQPGWGASLKWSLNLKLASNLVLDLNINNFPCVMYVPALTFENGKIDSNEASIQPISISGFLKKGNAWVSLPLETVGSLNMLLDKGLLRFKFTSSGMVQDFSGEYIHDLTNKLKMAIEVNPIMEDLSVGCLWLNGELKLFFDPFSEWHLNGLMMSLKL